MRVFYLWAFCCALLLGCFTLAEAQEVSPARGSLSVTPALVKVDLKEDPAEIELIYKNDSDQVVELTLTAEDFTALEDGWKATFFDKEAGQNYAYSLASWLRFAQTTAVIDPHSELRTKVFIDAQRLSPGGHYAAVQAKMVPQEVGGQIAVESVLSSLVFVRTSTGMEHEDGAVHQLNCPQKWWMFPTRCTLRFRNGGNVDLTPYGAVQIKDLYGIFSQKMILNENSQIVLPEHIRSYDLLLPKLPVIVLPGYYSVSVDGRYGESVERRFNYHQEFFTLGSPLIILIEVLYLASFSVFLMYFLPRILRKRKDKVTE